MKFQRLIERARLEVMSGEREVLVSVSERIFPVDPLAGLERAVRLSAIDERFAKEIAAGCVYWARPADEFAFAGIGAAATLAPVGSDRFDAANSEWRSLLGSAMAEESAESGPVVGPILTGGFAFDDTYSRSGAWSEFGVSHLVVPKVLVTSSGGDTWLTVTAIVSFRSTDNFDLELISSLCDAMCIGLAARPDEQRDQDHKAKLEYSQPIPEAGWREIVHLAVSDIKSGSLEKVVVAREQFARASKPIDAFAVLRHCYSNYPESFVFGYWRGERVFVGASPERLARVDRKNVFASSVAGTIARGTNAVEDASNARSLLESEKDQAEHAIVHDAIHLGLESQCVHISAPVKPLLLSLPHVHHLHTPFRAQLKPGASLLTLVRELHPTPAVGGSPREAALSFIRNHEQLDRGWYASPVGWVGRQGGEFAVALRCALIENRNAVLFAGCGIVADSDPELEYAESALKMRSMQRALGAAIA